MTAVHHLPAFVKVSASLSHATMVFYASFHYINHNFSGFIGFFLRSDSRSATGSHPKKSGGTHGRFGRDQAGTAYF